MADVVKSVTDTLGAPFRAISDALSGNRTAANDQVGSGPQAAQGSFDDDMAIKRRNMKAMGLNIDGSPMAKSNKPLPNINDHADALHPVKK